MKQNVKFYSGFNLVEILIVIGIIGILAAAIVPTVGRYLPGIQLNGSARVLTSNLREAQEKSITEQRQYLIRFHPTDIPPSYELIRIEDGNEELQKQINFSGNEAMQLEASITNSQIIFSPDGGPSSSGNITLSINDVNKIISVSPAGFIKIQ